MAASQISQNKRARDEYWNGEPALPDAKRASSGRLRHDGDLIALLEKIDNMDDNHSNSEETATVIQLEGEMRLNGANKSLEDKIGLMSQTDNKIESSDEKGSTNLMGSNKQGELSAERNSEITLVASDIGDFTYYEDVRAELDFFVDNITPNELGIIIQNHIDGDSMRNIMHSDAVQDNAETSEFFYGSLWENDIWQLNEQLIVQNVSESPQQEECEGTGAEFLDICI